MRVVLLGTGSADGWPNPFCGCASCDASRRAGLVRHQTAALVDGRLLLDCGPEAPRAAERLGHPLTGVEAILLTHAHPDHVGPAALLWRQWAMQRRKTGDRPLLRVLGPPGALDLCRDWVGPDDPVEFLRLGAGEEVTLLGEPGYVVRALPAAHGDATTGEALLYRLTGPDGSRLLWATDTGPLPQPALDLLAGTPLDAVLMEETFGTLAPPGRDHASDHLDLHTFGKQLERLREVGAVTAETVVAAIHLGHHNPPPDELARRLADLGAELPADGDVIVTRSPEGRARHQAGPSLTAARPVSALPALTLVTGGARSGKSVHAESLLQSSPAVTYLATGIGRTEDAEWAERVERHRARRPSHWRTVETTDVRTALATAEGPVLLDCLSLWLTAVLDRLGVWEEPDVPRAALDATYAELLDALVSSTHPVVVVTNEVGSGVVPATRAGRVFRDELGRLNAIVAAAAQDVVLCVAGRAVRL